MRSLERAGRYHAMIAPCLAEEKVPQDLIYQAVAESGFQPQISECPFRRRGDVAVYALRRLWPHPQWLV